VRTARGHVQNLPSKFIQKLITLNLFKVNQREAWMTEIKEQYLTRFFIALLVICSIMAGLFIGFSEQDQIVTVEYPSLATYDQLYKQYGSTIECPCSHVSVLQGTFLNITPVLHQVCSSSLVSPIWLNYLAQLDPNRVHTWTYESIIFDFRLHGIAYFQFLATFCSLARVSIDDAQHAFTSTAFISSHLPTRTRFRQQIQDISDSYINRTRASFSRMIDWIEINNLLSNFLSGTNINARISFGDDGQIVVRDATYTIGQYLPDGDFESTNMCSCAQIRTCLMKSCVTHDELQVFGTLQELNALPIGCVPLHGFFSTVIDWWYNMTYVETIQSSYHTVIDHPLPLDIEALNRSVPTQFDGFQTSSLLRRMLVEKFIYDNDDSRFNVFYRECAPLSCTYRVTQRRDRIVAILLLITVCGGLNQVLRFLVPLIGKRIFYAIKRCQHSNTVHRKN
jgi:hypothetical protein